MVRPPLLVGAVKATLTLLVPAVTVPIVGAVGTPVGVALAENADAAPVPIAFVAVTVKVYAWPLLRPLTTRGEPLPLAVSPPGAAVAV